MRTSLSFMSLEFTFHNDNGDTATTDRDKRVFPVCAGLRLVFSGCADLKDRQSHGRAVSVLPGPTVLSLRVSGECSELPGLGYSRGTTTQKDTGATKVTSPRRDTQVVDMHPDAARFFIYRAVPYVNSPCLPRCSCPHSRDLVSIKATLTSLPSQMRPTPTLRIGLICDNSRNRNRNYPFFCILRLARPTLPPHSLT